MPMYEYFCETCEQAFTELRPMAEHLAPQPCPGCGAGARRIVGGPPRLGLMPEGLRRAHETNERSAHEPRTGPRHRCGPSCDHKPGAGGRARAGSPVRSRPWMLGH